MFIMLLIVPQLLVGDGGRCGVGPCIGIQCGVLVHLWLTQKAASGAPTIQLRVPCLGIHARPWVYSLTWAASASPC